MGQPVLDAPMPEGLVMEPDGGGGLVFRFRWFSASYVLMAAFCVFWDAFLVFWYRTALRAPHPPAMMLWFPLLHVGVGIGLTYATLAGFVNRTEVRVGQGTLSVHHGPLPWRGALELATGEIEQLYREERISSGRQRSVTYPLNARLRNGRKRTLFTTRNPDVPLYVEQQLERHLGIEDVHVVGEMEK